MRAALFLTPEAPYPAVGGGALRSASLFEYLIRNYEVDVIAFRQPGQPDPRDSFPSGAARHVCVLDLPFHSFSTSARLLRNVRRAVQGRPPLLDRFSGFDIAMAQAIGSRQYDAGLIEHFWCAPYEAVLRPHCAKLLLDLHNIESAWHGSLAASSNPVSAALHHRFESAYRLSERTWLPRFDRLLATSSEDSRRVAQFAPVTVYPNAIPARDRPIQAERDAIIFTGNLEYAPNISAVRFFKDRIWPLLRRQWPGLIWEIAGKNPRAIQHLTASDPRICLTGPVADAVARIASAKVAVVPLLAGSGTRMKILEAWAAATPVVSTSVGAEGLDFTPGVELSLADDPASFASAVSGLLANPAERKRMGEAGRRQYESVYTWESAWKALAGVL